jgi:hypothetical protein
VADALFPSRIDGPGNRCQQALDFNKTEWLRLPQIHVERIARQVLEREERCSAFGPAIQRGHQTGDTRRARGEGSQRLSQAIGVFRYQIEFQGFDGNKPLAGVVRAKNRAQYATANLMQDAIRRKRGRRVYAGQIVKWQCGGSLRTGNRSTSVVD